MPTVFKKTLLEIGGTGIEAPKCPNVNVRQVWARMLSQLVVKSEAAIHWGGKTIWVIQDLLGNYIDETTGLDIGAFEATQLDEINILSCGIEAPISLKLYAGKISSGALSNKSFADILRAPFLPDLEWDEMVTKSPFCEFTVE